MKIFKLLIVFAFCSQLSAQDFIQKSDGTTIEIAKGSVHVSPVNHYVAYNLPNNIEPYYIKYKDLDVAHDGDRLFKIAKLGKKVRGFYILGEANGNQLGALFARRITNKGGFEASYIHFELAVIDNSGNVIKSMTFTDVNNDKNKKLRREAVEFMESFANCTLLKDRLNAFKELEDQPLTEALTTFFRNPYLTKCQ